MAEFNRTSLDIMDEIYAPFKEAQAQKHGLERQAGGAALARQLQLTDADTKRQQQVTDAATAHESGLERITHQVDEQARAAEETAQKRRDENLKDQRAEAGAIRDRLEKKGINLPFTIEDINSASTGQMSSYMRELKLEEEIDHANKKSHAEILERLKAVDEEILREVMGLELDHLIDWDAEGQKSKSELADMLGQAVVKKNTRKFGKNVVPQYKHLLKQQMELLEDTGILDIIQTNPPGSDEAAMAIAQDEIFILNLNKALTNSNWIWGNDIPKKAEEILGLLSQGDLKTASERLDGEGQAGNQPLIDAFTRWAAKRQGALAARIQDRILRMQGGPERLRSIGQQLNGLVARHPWLEETVDILDIYTDNEYEAFQGRRRAASPPPTSLEPGDPGLEGTTLFNQAGEVTDDSGEVIPGQMGGDAPPRLGSAVVANLVNPQAAPETQAAPQPQVQGQQQYTTLPGENNLQTIANKFGVSLESLIRENPAVPHDQVVSGQILYIPTALLDRFDRDGDGTLGAYEKLLKADEDKGFASGAGGSIGGGTIAPDERSWGGKQLDKAGNYLFPRYMAGEQQASFVERYDPDADYWGLLNSYAAGDAPSDIRAGAGDVVLEFGGMLADAWLAAGGINILRSAPAALGRVRALVSKPSGLGIGAFGRTAGNPTARIHILAANRVSVKELAKALGGGAALESLKAFVKTPANIKEAVRRIRQSGMRYSHGATPRPVPKRMRLNFTPAPSGTPIVPPAP